MNNTPLPDILQRLRAAGNDYTVEWGTGELYDKAADEIERLQMDTAIVDWLSAHPRLAEFTGTDGVTTDCVYYAVSGAPGLTLREIMTAIIDTTRRK